MMRFPRNLDGTFSSIFLKVSMDDLWSFSSNYELRDIKFRLNADYTTSPETLTGAIFTGFII